MLKRSVLLIAALACSRSGSGRSSGSVRAGGDSQAARPTTQITSLNVAPDSGPDSATDLRITSIEARLIAPDGTPTSPNLVDNANADRHNLGPFRIKFSITVRWRRQATRAARLDFWVRENGKEVFAQSGDVALRADSTAFRADFSFEDGGCEDMVIRAFVWIPPPGDTPSLPQAAEVYRYLPFDCGE